MRSFVQTSRLLVFTCFLTVYCCKKKQSAPAPPPVAAFANPLMNGSDPWVIRKDSFYYYTQTQGNRVSLWKTKTMSRLATAPIRTVFTPVAGTPNSANLWAPELHYLDGKWYIYFTAGSGPDETQRTWVLENSDADPTTGSWTVKGKIFSADTDFWAIDGTVLEYNGQRYFLWSGRPDPSVQDQNIYIARMSNPWTISSTSTVLTKPELAWEQHGGPVNEAPQVLKEASGKLFIIYSASGCWTDNYALGMLTLKPGGDPLNAADWTKSAQPVFSGKAENLAYGPGHNAFFTSPDNSENWIIYHANSNSGDGCGERRNIRMQPFTWTATGIPVFGEPVKTGAPIPRPSGE